MVCVGCERLFDVGVALGVVCCYRGLVLVPTVRGVGMCELVIVKCWTCGTSVDALEGSRAYCSIDCVRYALTGEGE